MGAERAKVFVWVIVCGVRWRGGVWGGGGVVVGVGGGGGGQLDGSQ